MPSRSLPISATPTRYRHIGLLGLAVVLASGLMLSACNTTAGVGRDVSATGAAVTRGANDVKTGL